MSKKPAVQNTNLEDRVFELETQMRDLNRRLKVAEGRLLNSKASSSRKHLKRDLESSNTDAASRFLWKLFQSGAVLGIPGKESSTWRAGVENLAIPAWEKFLQGGTSKEILEILQAGANNSTFFHVPELSDKTLDAIWDACENSRKTTRKEFIPDPEDFHRLPTEDVNELRAYIHADGKYKIRPNHTNDRLCWEIFYKNTDPQNSFTWCFWGYYSSFYLAINAVRKLTEEQWNSDNYFVRQPTDLYDWQTKDENWIIYKTDKVWVAKCQKINLEGSYNSLSEAAKFVRDNSLVWEENPSMNHGNRKAWKTENISVIPSVEPTEFFIVGNTKSYHAEYFKYTSEGRTVAWRYAQTLTKKYVPEIPKD